MARRAGSSARKRTRNAVSALPKVVGISPVASDMIRIEIRGGTVVPHRLRPYVKRPGDKIQIVGPGKKQRILVRSGRKIGWLAGPKSDHICTFETLRGNKLDDHALGDRSSYELRSRDDRRFATRATPIAVYRKSKPYNWACPSRRFAMTHYIYLRWPVALKAGASYTLRLKNTNAASSRLVYRHDPRKTVSEAVHVSHIGFRPDDPCKHAFLSLWLGTGGPCSFVHAAPLRFFLLEHETSKSVFEGEVRPAKAATDTEWMRERKNHNHSHVYRMDFGDFFKPGTYQVYVEGVGCSLPFEIGTDVWRTALQVSMKGFYHMRSGIELGPPYTEYRRPRCHHPDDGIKVYHSTAPIMETGNGLNIYKTDKNNFGNLTAGRTSTIVPNAWGGYHDAADWDRRIQHLGPSRHHLELYELFPGYFNKLDLNIPESGNGLPDIVNEALWNIDCYRRMQNDEGGVRGGIEATSHPNKGEASWLESLTVMAYAPGMWASHFYVSLAARAAYVLRDVDPQLSVTYAQSAAKAMVWAEKEWRRRRSDQAVAENTRVSNTRNLAALEMYRLTGVQKWLKVFMQHTWLRDSGSDGYGGQADATFLYARLGKGEGDPRLKRKARAAIVAAANAVVSYSRQNAFGLGATSHERALGHCFFSVPQANECIRAHHLTGKEQYLETAIRVAQFSAGANPMNMTYTTGLGHDWPRNPMHLDSRYSGQPVPAGITIYGQGDNEYWRAHDSNYYLWMVYWYHSKVCVPSAWVWPPVECYFDVNQPASSTEYTPQQTMGNTSYVWGYLAARS